MQKLDAVQPQQKRVNAGQWHMLLVLQAHWASGRVDQQAVGVVIKGCASCRQLE